MICTVVDRLQAVVLLLPCAAACRSQLLHYIVIVAAEDIPKYTELTYDYGSMYILPEDVSGIHTHSCTGTEVASGMAISAADTPRCQRMCHCVCGC